MELFVYTTGPTTQPMTITGVEGACPGAAGADQTNALTILNAVSQGCTDLGAAVTLNNATGHLTGVYTPGCYSSSGAGATSMTITTGTTVTLDGGGDPNAVFIFKAAGALKPAANTSIVLTGGASANNVFWAPVEATTIGANTTFIGNIIDAAGITIGSTSTLLGRALAFGGTVTTDTDTITVPTILTLNKTVDNTGGGVALPTEWTLSTIAPSPTLISGATGNINVTNTTVVPGAYTLSESGGPGDYATGTYSCVKNGGAAVVSNSISLLAGDNATCTITNTFIPPAPVTLTLTKTVINIGGGTKTADDFQAKIDGVNVPWVTPQTLTTGVQYTASEVNLSNYTASDWGGGCAADGTITLVPGVNTCTITNTYVHPSGGGGSYTPPVPPLIDLVKVPSPLALPAGPGPITYTYTVRNIGTVPMTNVTLVDDSCSPMVFVSGDINADAKLDVNETWTYDCFKTLSATHTNIATATGWANGISATDISTATVVVGIPIIPPLIHVTKIPNPLALKGAGIVTYTYIVTNPGTEPLSNVSIVDDKCTGLPGRVLGHPGDLNKNNLLESNETWSFTCKSNLTKTTTNTATASGTANGIIAKDFAIATVVVTNVPKLPKTGYPPQEKSAMLPIVLLSGLSIVSIFLYFAQKKQTT